MSDQQVIDSGLQVRLQESGEAYAKLKLVIGDLPKTSGDYTRYAVQAAAFGLGRAGSQQRIKNIRSLAVAQADMFNKTGAYLRSLIPKELALYDQQAAEQIGSLRAGYAGRGVRVGTGTPLHAVVASRRRHQFNKLYLKHARMIQARGFEDRATMALMAGDQAAYDQQVEMFEDALTKVTDNRELLNFLGGAVAGDWSTLGGSLKGLVEKIDLGNMLSFGGQQVSATYVPWSQVGDIGFTDFGH